MAQLEILHYPDDRLRTKAKPVEKFDDQLRKLVDNMFETMYEAPGIGLAATQVNVHQQVVVIDISPEKDQPLCLINPEIIERNGEEILAEEGCLSVPDIYDRVQRDELITVKAFDQHGKEFTLKAAELLAVCIQHELDHLQGKLFVDYLSPLKQQRYRKKLEKARRLHSSV
ncbi:MAG: peptide deformylase [Gammaproteobacteria bacterium]|nr:peptide deformylase [Gammaproteobacteria bacterium]